MRIHHHTSKCFLHHWHSRSVLLWILIINCRQQFHLFLLIYCISCEFASELSRKIRQKISYESASMAPQLLNRRVTGRSRSCCAMLLSLSSFSPLWALSRIPWSSWTNTMTGPSHENPSSVIIDEHYLCTVAAGGHEMLSSPSGRYPPGVIQSLSIASFIAMPLNGISGKDIRFHPSCIAIMAAMVILLPNISKKWVWTWSITWWNRWNTFFTVLYQLIASTNRIMANTSFDQNFDLVKHHRCSFASKREGARYNRQI